MDAALPIDHHHRYLRAAVIVLPILAPLEGWVVHASERWADDDAAAIVGDRQVVARALARVAANAINESLAPVLAFGATGVAERIAALTNPRPPSPHWSSSGSLS